MKSKMAKAALIALACLLGVAVSPAPAFAAAATPKDETVYVNLAGDGSVEGIYVVNAFEMDAAGTITDYGRYASVKNLSTTDAIREENGVNTVDAVQGRFYYQGEMEQTVLPWKFGITYLLDGEAVDAQSLAGASGALEICVAVEQGDARYQSFYDNYVLQISYTLDAEHCTGVTAENANVVTAGKNISVGYTVMQAAEPAVYTLQATVSEFEMSAIQIKALHTGTLSIDTGEYTEKLDEAQADFQELADGVAELADAGGKLSGASGRFSSGLDEFAGGIQQVADASAGMGGAIDSLSGTFNALSSGTSDTLVLAQALLSSEDPQVKALAQAYIAQSQAVAGGAQGLSELNAQYQNFDGAVQSLPENAEKLADGYSSMHGGLRTLSNALDELNENVSGIPEELQTMRDDVDEAIGKYNNPDFEPASFVNEANTVDSVLFVMKTGEVSIPEPEEPEEAPVGPDTFFEKLLDLFGLYKADA
jgi:putative membrane protein